MSSHNSVAWQFSRTALPWPTSGPFMCCTPQIPPDRGFLGGRFRLRQGCLLDPAPQCLLSWADHVKRWAASSMLGHSWTQDALKSSEPQYMKDLHPNPPRPLYLTISIWIFLAEGLLWLDQGTLSSQSWNLSYGKTIMKVSQRKYRWTGYLMDTKLNHKLVSEGPRRNLLEIKSVGNNLFHSWI